MAGQKDTLVAIATAPGRGGIGIVRLSGELALTIAKKLTKRDEFQPRHAYFCQFNTINGDWLDEGLALYFPAPHSFTGEDVVELQGHGGPVILDMLVAACIEAGATQAGPGDFSLRAFLNDKLDLTQAEAIADMIDAGTRQAAQAAHRSLQGAFSKQVDALVEALIQLRVYVEAAIDFPEEEIDFLSDGHIASKLTDLVKQVKSVRAAADRGRLLRDGITLVLVGKPNAGKSSLLNQLTGEDTAIVTEQAGTTRDLLTQQVVLDGIPVNLVDTAGLRDSDDVIEQEGINRARRAVNQADAIVFMVDSTAHQPDKTAYAELLGSAANLAEQQVVWVLNKCDLSGITAGRQSDYEGKPVFAISAKGGDGLGELTRHIKHMAGWTDSAATPFSARRRHLQALDDCLDCLAIGESNLQGHQAGELLAEDLRQAQSALEAITGAFTADNLLGEIFGSFCIGK